MSETDYRDWAEEDLVATREEFLVKSLAHLREAWLVDQELDGGTPDADAIHAVLLLSSLPDDAYASMVEPLSGPTRALLNVALSDADREQDHLTGRSFRKERRREAPWMKRLIETGNDVAT